MDSLVISSVRHLSCNNRVRHNMDKYSTEVHPSSSAAVKAPSDNPFLSLYPLTSNFIFSPAACRVFSSGQCPGHHGAGIAVGHLPLAISATVRFRSATVLPAALPPSTHNTLPSASPRLRVENPLLFHQTDHSTALLCDLRDFAVKYSLPFKNQHSSIINALHTTNPIFLCTPLRPQRLRGKHLPLPFKNQHSSIVNALHTTNPIFLRAPLRPQRLRGKHLPLPQCPQ